MRSISVLGRCNHLSDLYRSWGRGQRPEMQVQVPRVCRIFAILEKFPRQLSSLMYVQSVKVGSTVVYCISEFGSSACLRNGISMWNAHANRFLHLALRDRATWHLKLSQGDLCSNYPKVTYGQTFPSTASPCKPMPSLRLAHEDLREQRDTNRAAR